MWILPQLRSASNHTDITATITYTTMTTKQRLLYWFSTRGLLGARTVFVRYEYISSNSQTPATFPHSYVRSPAHTNRFILIYSCACYLPLSLSLTVCLIHRTANSIQKKAGWWTRAQGFRTRRAAVSNSKKRVHAVCESLMNPPGMAPNGCAQTHTCVHILWFICCTHRRIGFTVFPPSHFLIPNGLYSDSVCLCVVPVNGRQTRCTDNHSMASVLNHIHMVWCESTTMLDDDDVDDHDDDEQRCRRQCCWFGDQKTTFRSQILCSVLTHTLYTLTINTPHTSPRTYTTKAQKHNTFRWVVLRSITCRPCRWCSDIDSRPRWHICSGNLYQLHTTMNNLWQCPGNIPRSPVGVWVSSCDRIEPPEYHLH